MVQESHISVRHTNQNDVLWVAVVLRFPTPRVKFEGMVFRVAVVLRFPTPRVKFEGMVFPMAIDACVTIVETGTKIILMTYQNMKHHQRRKNWGKT